MNINLSLPEPLENYIEEPEEDDDSVYGTPGGNDTLIDSTTPTLALAKSVPGSVPTSARLCPPISSQTTVEAEVLSSQATDGAQTLVFLDIEATGFLQPDTEMVEISLVAVPLSEFQLPAWSSHGLPRVMNKINLCFSPERLLSNIVSSIIACDTSQLSAQPRFSRDSCEQLLSFLSSISPKPLVLIAHNGFGYDFPLLAREFSSCGSELPPDLLCLDSLLMFRELRADPSLRSCVTRVPGRTDRLQRVRRDLFNVKASKTQDEVPDEFPSTNCTPAQASTSEGSTSGPAEVLSQSHSTTAAGPRKPNSLPELHREFLGAPPAISHAAEADCLSLVRLVRCCAHLALPYISRNAVTLRSALSGVRKTPLRATPRTAAKRTGSPISRDTPDDTPPQRSCREKGDGVTSPGSPDTYLLGRTQLSSAGESPSTSFVVKRTAQLLDPAGPDTPVSQPPTSPVEELQLDCDLTISNNNPLTNNCKYTMGPASLEAANAEFSDA